MKCPSCGADNDAGAEVCFTCGKAMSVLTKGAIVGNRYEILDILGKGGMGVVFRAHDRVLEEDVAIKVLRRDITATEEMASRFRSEIKLARRVSHTNVCLIHDYGEDGGLSYISMALLEGRDLKQLLAEHPAGLPQADALDVAVQVADGLQAIHEAGIIHRDLKTANIIRDPEGVVRLMDFGIAKDTDPITGGGLTATGMVLGTPEYMSPEQCRGEKLAYSSDVYSLGVVVFELFTGSVPFRGETPIATLFKHIQEPFVLEPSLAGRLPPGLGPVLDKALSKDPGSRFATAGALADALRELDAAESVAVAAPATRPPAEASEPAAPATGAAREERCSETRLGTPINVVLRRLDETGQVVQEERTIVDNISSRGARVMTSMSGLAVGEIVVIEEVGGDFKARASVRNAHTGGDKIPRLGLRFEAGRAPDRLVQTDDVRASTHTMRAVNLPAPPRERPPRPAGRSATPKDEPGKERRTSTRIESPLEVWIKRLGPDGAVIQKERTLCENISRGGVRVMTSMTETTTGEIMLVEEVGGDFQARATIRHAYVGGDRIRRFNLEFVEAKAPDRLALPDDLRNATMSFKAVSASLAAEREPAAAGAGAETPVTDDDAQRDELLEAYAGLKTATHFEALGLPRASSAEHVKTAYVKLARRYHPDAGLGARLTELKMEISAVFVRLSEAYRVLSDPGLRAEYETRLGPNKQRNVPRAAAPPAVTATQPSASRVAKAPPAAARATASQPAESKASSPRPASTPATRPSETAETRQARAEQALGSALSLLREEKYWDAIQVVERSLKDAEESPSIERRLKITLAQATRRNPKWRKRAEGIFQEVLAQDPSDVEAHYELALLYKDSGLDSRAQRALRRVLELDPGHEQAAAALQSGTSSGTKRFKIF